MNESIDFDGHYVRFITDEERDYTIEIRGLVAASVLRYHCTEQKARLTFERICARLPVIASARLLCNGEELCAMVR